MPDTPEITKARDFIAKHMKMHDDFVEIGKKLEECAKSGDFQPALDYVINDMSAKPQYGNGLAKIKDHPADLIIAVTDIHATQHEGMLNKFAKTVNLYQQFAVATPVNPANQMQWRKMCSLLENFMAETVKSCAGMEQTALRYIGGALALRDVADKFSGTNGGMTLDMAGDDGVAASTRLTMLENATRTIANDAEAWRNNVIVIYALYSKACDNAKRPRQPIVVNDLNSQKIAKYDLRDALSDILNKFS